MSCIITASVLAFVFGSKLDASSPVGRWLTFDEANGDTLALVKIFETEHGLAGEIEKLFLRPHEGEHGRCARCPDARRNQRIIGMMFLRGFEAHGNEWRNGEILDPATGKLYRASLALEETGNLKISVNIGPLGLLKRSQIWRRPAAAKHNDSIEGLWQIYNEEHNLPSSTIRLEQREGKLEGHVLETFLMPDAGPEARCLACPGELRDRKIVGLQILSEMKRAEEKWAGGKILDPANGKSYSCSLWLEASDRLKVRGHTGPFTRTQVWRRMGE